MYISNILSLIKTDCKKSNSLHLKTIIDELDLLKETSKERRYSITWN